MEGRVARLMHIHELAGLPSSVIHTLGAISGCPISYGVSYMYKSMLALTSFREVPLIHSILQPLNLA